MNQSLRVLAHATLPIVLLLAVSSCNTRSKLPPLEPEDALETFELPPGFRIELVASEPLISDPVEIAFDADGFLYVAEMEDYPAQGDPGGRIMILEDSDSDGHFERGNVFADKLPYVNGVMPWRRGVLVTSAPDILYLEDTDGDRRADVREVVLTGFAFTNPQLRMSSLRYGLDNQIYGAYSRSGGQRGYPEFTNHGSPLKFPKDPKKRTADIYPGNDFRFHPDSFHIEPAGGMSQFGMSFDARGNRFTVWNNVHLRHVAMDGRYAGLNPWFSPGSLMQNVSDHGDAADVYSRSENRLDLHESEMGHFTSACGHSVYTGDLFSDPYAGAVFVCEPVSNIVHADLLSPKGATFSASRALEGKEFLSSTDSWFRPVNTTVGPDGALYVVDFHRKLVEHPAWIARADEKGIYTHAGVLQEADFLEGNDRGRIYRIVPKDYERKNTNTPRLSDATTQELVALLTHRNTWWRMNAQRLLVERADKAAIPLLKKLFDEASSAEAKIHTLRTLEGLRALDEGLVIKALSDDDVSVKKHAVQVAESWLASPAIRGELFSLVDDPAPEVQYQVALTLSLLPDEVSFEALQRIAAKHLGDDWFHKAVLLSARENVIDWFNSAGELQVQDESDRKGKLKLLQQVASIAGRRQHRGELSQLVSNISSMYDTASQKSALRGVTEGLMQAANRVLLSNGAQDALIKMMTTSTVDVQSASIGLAENIRFERWAQLHKAMGDRLQSAFNSDAPTVARLHAIRLLGLNPRGVEMKQFAHLLSPRQPEEVQSAAARVLIRREERTALQLLADRYNTSTPKVRTIIEGGFSQSANRMSLFIEAVADGRINPALLSPAFRSRLTQHPDKAIAERVRSLMVDIESDDRDAVVNRFYESTIMNGDAARGKEIFRKTCSTCHVMDGLGHAFGPDLLSVSNQTRINLLTMILDPNNNIAPGYDGYLIETSDGRTFTGILGNETSTGVTLRTADGREEIISRDQILTLKPMTTSLMPPGLEAGLTTQDVADLLEYLKRGSGLSGLSDKVPTRRRSTK